MTILLSVIKVKLQFHVIAHMSQSIINGPVLLYYYKMRVCLYIVRVCVCLDMMIAIE